MQLQTCLYIILFDLVAISDSVYTALLPYFSPVATEKGFTETEIGIMLAFYPIGSVVAAPLVSACKSKRRAMLIGLFLSTFATLGIGLSKFLDGTLFYVFSSLSRFVIGIGASFLLIPSYAAVPILFKDTVTEKIAGLEMGHCIGRMLSTGFFTVLAQSFSFDTYQLPCYGLAMIYVVSYVFTYKLFYLSDIPEEISPKKKAQEPKKENVPIHQTKSQIITPIEILVQNDNSLVQNDNSIVHDELNQSQQQFKPADHNLLEVPQIAMQKNNSSGDDKSEESTIEQKYNTPPKNEKKAISKLQRQIKNIIQQQKEGKQIAIPDSPKQDSNCESTIKMKNSSQLQSLEVVEETEEAKLTYKDYIGLFKSPSLQVTFVFFFWLSCLENGLRPFLANELGDMYNLSEYNISYMFMIPIFTYLLAAITVAKQHYFQELTLFKIGMWILGVSFFFYCPTIIGLPQSIAFIIIGEVARGISLGICCALFVPNISDSVIAKFGLCKANLIGANLYQFGWSLGDVLGPILCGAFVQKTGYEMTTLVGGVVVLVFNIIYMIFRKSSKQLRQVSSSTQNNDTKLGI